MFLEQRRILLPDVAKNPIPPLYLLGEGDDHRLRTVEISIYTFGVPRDHIPLSASYS